jgi:LmbE family N-acetylglucosaminyl deacetylase
LMGAEIRFVAAPDGVFRGYVGGSELMSPPRADDPAPVEQLRAALADLAPERLYLPFSIGGHVDHRQTRRAAIALLAEPGSPYLDRASFYEDFPYSLMTGFERLEQLDPEVLASLPAGAVLQPEYVEIGDLIERKVEALRAYESQIGHLFGGADGGADGGHDDGGPAAEAIRKQTTRVGELGGVGPSERYWRITLP